MIRAFLIIGAIIASVLSACASPRVSLINESCTKTADCKRPLRCLQQTCVKIPSKRTEGPHKTVVSLAKAIFHAVKGQSPHSLLKLLPSEAVLRKAALVLKEAPEVLIKEIITDSKRDLPYRWQKLATFATRCKIDIKTLRFVKLMPFNIKSRGPSLAKLDRDLNIHVTDAQGRSWRIDIESVHKLEGHWYLTDAEVEIDPFDRTQRLECMRTDVHSSSPRVGPKPGSKE